MGVRHLLLLQVGSSYLVISHAGLRLFVRTGWHHLINVFLHAVTPARLFNFLAHDRQMLAKRVGCSAVCLASTAGGIGSLVAERKDFCARSWDPGDDGLQFATPQNRARGSAAQVYYGIALLCLRWD